MSQGLCIYHYLSVKRIKIGAQYFIQFLLLSLQYMFKKTIYSLRAQPELIIARLIDGSVVMVNRIQQQALQAKTS
jgi:hypothetical protein